MSVGVQGRLRGGGLVGRWRARRRATEIDRAAEQIRDRLKTRGAAALVSDGVDAFALRALTARASGRTLDLQYYAWRGDATGRLLAREVLDAADRGVRVRLLLDDTAAIDGSFPLLATLSEHPNIEMRLFNATSWRRWGRLGFAVELALGGWRLNRRMHNKAWIADGRIAIAGGRNIGDAYFEGGCDTVFRDLDMVLTGRGAAQTRRVFEAFWRHRMSACVQKLAGPAGVEGDLAGLRAELAKEIEGARPFLDRIAAAPPLARALASRYGLHSTDDLHVVADSPEKAGLDVVRPGELNRRIESWISAAERSVLLISAYFVPGERGTRLLGDLARRGVRVAVVTNSLSATDVAVVHGGYARYRRRLLAAGVELYELRRTGHEDEGVLGSRGASLHSKALLIDDELVGVGSFNLDPRSERLNTEMGAFVRHPDLARCLRHEFERLTHPALSWRVRLEGDRLVWECEEGGARRLCATDPDALWKRRVLARLVRWLPVEAHL
jgi:putative cardiolipin synthase